MHVLPLRIADSFSARWRWGHARITVGPLVPDEVIELFTPHHTGKSLTLDVAEIVVHRHGADAVVKLIGFLKSLVHDVVEKLFIDVALGHLLGDAETDNGTLTRWYTLALVECIPGCTLGSGLGRVDSVLLLVDNVSVESVLGVFRLVLLVLAPDGLEVGVVVGEEELRVNIFSETTNVGRRRALEVALAELLVVGLASKLANLLALRLGVVVTPGPGVAEPDVRDDVQLSSLRATVVGCHTEQKLIRVIRLFGSLDEDIPVLVVLESVGVDQVVLALGLVAASVLLNEMLVGELLLRVLVEELHVRVL